MRVTAGEGDFLTRKIHSCTLDGADIKKVAVTADDVEGWADCIVRTPPTEKRPNGEVVFSVSRDPVMERRVGKVAFSISYTDGRPEYRTPE